MQILVSLEWPPRGLSPNARLDRFSKARLFKTTKLRARLATMDAMNGRAAHLPEGEVVNLRLVCRPPVLRHRDEDNLIASCKAVFDGIASALKVDDHLFHFREMEWREVDRAGRGGLTVEVEWRDEEE